MTPLYNRDPGDECEACSRTYHTDNYVTISLTHWGHELPQRSIKDIIQSMADANPHNEELQRIAREQC